MTSVQEKKIWFGIILKNNFFSFFFLKEKGGRGGEDTSHKDIYCNKSIA